MKMMRTLFPWYVNVLLASCACCFDYEASHRWDGPNDGHHDYGNPNDGSDGEARESCLERTRKLQAIGSGVIVVGAAVFLIPGWPNSFWAFDCLG